jgi:hypothetical protein
MNREPFVDETVAASFLAVTIRYLRDLRHAGRVHGHALGCKGKCRVWRHRPSELESALCHLPTNPAVASDGRSKCERSVVGGAGR